MSKIRKFAIFVFVVMLFSFATASSIYAVAPAGLVSWWPGEGNANDIAGTNNGTLQGGATFVPGIVGQAFSLDGVNDYIDVGAGYNLDSMTLAAWVFIDPATNTGDRRIISKDNYTLLGPRKLFTLKSSSNAWGAPGRASFQLHIAGANEILSAPSPLTAGWHHIAGVRDTAVGRFELYVDGALVASKTPTVLGPIDSAVSTVIGQVSPVYNAEFFNGLIDEAEIYDRALSAAEIEANVAPAAPIVLMDATALALSNGNVVSTWDGQTAAGTPTYLTNQTPNGKPAVEFNGGGDRMGDNIPLSPSAAGDWIVVAVIKPNNIGAYHNLVDDDASNRPMLWIDPAYNYELNFSGGSGAKGAGSGSGGWDIVIADSRLNQLYINSPTPNATGRSPIAFSAGESFDFFHRDGGQTFQGLVAELRIYNDRADFGSDFASLHNELYAKYFAIVNEAPTANAGGPYNGNEGAAIAMSGASASDADVDPLTYSWSVDSTLCSFDNAGLLNPNLTCSDDGSFNVTLTVDDGVNPAVSSSAAVAVNNVAPTAVASAAQTTLECTVGGVTAALDGSGSTDPAGVADSLSYTWIGSFPEGGGTVTGVNPIVTLTGVGTHLITLTVDDGDGGTGSDTVQVSVVDTTAPVVTASLDLQGHGDEKHDDDEGRFFVHFGATDACDPNLTVSAVLLVHGWPAPVSVADGQLIEFEFDDEEAEVEWETKRDGSWELEIEGPALTLQVTATDASGNSAVVEIQPVGLNPDNDDDYDIADDDD